MMLLQTSLVLIFSALIGFVAAQDFSGGNKCVFPVMFYISDRCQDFWKTDLTNVTADGECHYVPPSKYRDDVGPGPYYRAVCSNDGGYIQYTSVGCSDSTCTSCKPWSVYTGGAVFDMKNLQCQDLQLSSFVSYGPLDIRVEPVPTGAPVAPVTPAPQTIITISPVELPPSPVTVSTPMPITVATPAPVPAPTQPPVPVVPCSWDFRYYDRTATDSAYATCSIINLVAPDQRSTVIADGVCRDSGVPSLGFYQATCDGKGGIVFSKNKCSDATCQACDASTDVYTSTSFTSGACWTHFSSPLKAWVLMGDCNKPSCSNVMTTTRAYTLSGSP